jgi:alcohol dehydrogenase, propanol-preferring
VAPKTRAQRLERPAPIEERPLHIDEAAADSPGPGEVTIEVAACGVCRTDLQIVEGDIAAHRLPIVPGHQAVGRISSIGAGVTGRSIGQRVGVGWLAGTDGTCRSCVSGRENLCEYATFTGWDRDGGYAGLMTARADFTFPLPDALDDVAAAPLLCGGVIGYRSLRVSGIEPGGRLGLFGFGASALLAIQVAVHWGCEVFVATRSDREQERARRLGATWAGGYDEPVPVPLDAVVTFAPVGRIVVAALQSLDRGGVVAINAIHLDRIPEFAYEALWWERQLRSVANFTRRDAEEFLALAAEIPIRTVTEAYPLGLANEALSDLKAGHVDGAAVLVP